MVETWFEKKKKKDNILKSYVGKFSYNFIEMHMKKRK